MEWRITSLSAKNSAQQYKIMVFESDHKCRLDIACCRQVLAQQIVLKQRMPVSIQSSFHFNEFRFCFCRNISVFLIPLTASLICFNADSRLCSGCRDQPMEALSLEMAVHSFKQQLLHAPILIVNPTWRISG